MLLGLKDSSPNYCGVFLDETFCLQQKSEDKDVRLFTIILDSYELRKA